MSASVPFRDLYPLLVEALGRAQLMVIIKACVLWGLVGALLGLVISLAAYRGFRRWRWYAAVSGPGRWLQRGALVLTAVVATLLLGVAGALHGVRQECQGALMRSPLGTDALPGLAGLLADGVAFLDLTLEEMQMRTSLDDARLTAFRAGSRELDVVTFLRRIDALNEIVYRERLGQLESALRENLPPRWAGVADRLLHGTVHGLGSALLDQKLDGELEKLGLHRIHRAIRSGLVAEAARAGQPNTITHAELSGFILHQGVVPTIVEPIRSFARQQQVICLVLTLVACFVPALVFRIAQRFTSADPADTAPTPPAPPPSPAPAR